MIPEHVRRKNLKNCKRTMDEKTFELYTAWYESYGETVITTTPLLDVETFCRTALIRKNWYSINKDVKEKYNKALSDNDLALADSYRILAFTMYGYGCWSNSQRKQKGLKPIRIKLQHKEYEKAFIRYCNQPAQIKPLTKKREFIPPIQSTVE